MTAPTANPRGLDHCSREWLQIISAPERFAGLAPGDVMPVFQGMMKVMCRACPAGQTRICQNIEKPLTYVANEILSPWLSMPWDFKAEEILASATSDASVRHEHVRTVIDTSEAIARSGGNTSVSLGDFVEAMVKMAPGWEYHQPEEVEPAFRSVVVSAGTPVEVMIRGRAEHKRRVAAFRADAQASRRNALAVMEQIPYEFRVHSLLSQRQVHWCGHVPHLFSRLLTRVALDDGALIEMFDLAEAVASEREHPGVTPGMSPQRS